MYKTMKELNPNIWIPHIWFFLYTVAHTYPEVPNAVSKRKYYDFVQNLPLYFPESSCSNHFSRVLDSFPVTPYLDNKDSFTYWVHCVHNRMNAYIGEPEKTYLQHLDTYYDSYLPKQYVLTEKKGIQKKYIVFGLIFVLCFFVVWQCTPSRKPNL